MFSVSEARRRHSLPPKRRVMTDEEKALRLATPEEADAMSRWRWAWFCRRWGRVVEPPWTGEQERAFLARYEGTEGPGYRGTHAPRGRRRR